MYGGMGGDGIKIKLHPHILVTGNSLQKTWGDFLQGIEKVVESLSSTAVFKD